MDMDAVPFDLDAVKKQARGFMARGAVTVDYSKDLEIAYQLLNTLLASEVMCMLRYRQHQITAKGINCIEIAAEFEEHAKEEESHMLAIAERIDQLGGHPEFDLAYIHAHSPTEMADARDILTMIQDNLVAERIAISIYRKTIAWFGDGDPTTRRLLERILNDEEGHASELADLLETDKFSTHLMRARNGAM